MNQDKSDHYYYKTSFNIKFLNISFTTNNNNNILNHFAVPFGQAAQGTNLNPSHAVYNSSALGFTPSGLVPSATAFTPRPGYNVAETFSTVHAHCITYSNTYHQPGKMNIM